MCCVLLYVNRHRVVPVRSNVQIHRTSRRKSERRQRCLHIYTVIYAYKRSPARIHHHHQSRPEAEGSPDTVLVQPTRPNPSLSKRQNTPIHGTPRMSGTNSDQTRRGVTQRQGPRERRNPPPNYQVTRERTQRLGVHAHKGRQTGIFIKEKSGGSVQPSSRVSVRALLAAFVDGLLRRIFGVVVLGCESVLPNQIFIGSLHCIPVARPRSKPSIHC